MPIRYTPAPGESGTYPAVANANTTRSSQASDKGKVVEMTHASASTFTVEPSVHAAGDVFGVYSAGAGGVTIAAGSGVTIRNLAALAQYQECSLRARSATEFVQVGP